jgi:hypothetical protein
LIVQRPTILKESEFPSWDEYIAAIERDPKCCQAVYGQRFHRGAGRGWSVEISALHLPNEYEHVVEFDQCGAVSYNGGISMKGSLGSRTPGWRPK